ncbi:hypothetical protein OUZ56_027545 [Daphnia magna]|uniref:Uncharacterized protein n=1 Tax=Daphnia magna TaxID=35525 RepID=A0ABQ9ZQ23_9CRUS|nr:hypothetical protein OUZ56_027545 [Daphnia magna]
MRVVEHAGQVGDTRAGVIVARRKRVELYAAVVRAWQALSDDRIEGVDMRGALARRQHRDPAVRRAGMVMIGRQDARIAGFAVYCEGRAREMLVEQEGGERLGTSEPRP